MKEPKLDKNFDGQVCSAVIRGLEDAFLDAIANHFNDQEVEDLEEIAYDAILGVAFIARDFAKGKMLAQR